MQEESIYRLLFERSAQGMVLRQGERIVLVNQSFADMVGYTIRELMDFSTEEGFNLIHPQDREAVLAGFRDLVAGKHGPRHDEYRFIRRNGETGWWSAALSSIDYEGQPAVLEVCVDITERKKAEAVLHDSDKLLHEIAANYPNSYLSIVESDMTIGFTAGQEFARQNLDPNAFVGQTIEQVFGEHTPTVREHYLQAFAGHDVAFELLINNQHQLYKAVPLRDRDGNIPRILVVVENITERRQAQAEIERLAHDLSERVKELNCLYGISQLVEEPGASLEDIVEGTVRLIPPAFQYPAITCARITLGDSTFTTENCSETVWRLSADIVAFGQRAGVLEAGLLEARPDGGLGPFLVEERALIDAIAERLGRIVERIRTDAALKQLNAELQARNEDLNAFAHTVAHDLKNPIAVIVGFAELLCQGYKALSESERNEYLNLIAKLGHKMRSIVDELLLLSSMRDMDEVEIVPLEMDRIMVEVQERLREMFDEYNAEMIVPERWPTAVGHGPWVEEVWVNYISNALRYGGKPPRLELGADEPAAGQVRFWVKDNGPGLSPADQLRVFEPFGRLGQQRREGHGLGLSIVRRIVEKLGGQAGVESTVGKGSTFYFTLPAGPIGYGE